jgi:hypothetical protein
LCRFHTYKITWICSSPLSSWCWILLSDILVFHLSKVDLFGFEECFNVLLVDFAYFLLSLFLTLVFVIFKMGCSLPLFVAIHYHLYLGRLLICFLFNILLYWILIELALALVCRFTIICLQVYIVVF